MRAKVAGPGGREANRPTGANDTQNRHGGGASLKPFLTGTLPRRSSGMPQRRRAGRRLNSSCRPVTASADGNQSEVRAAFVARLKTLVAGGVYVPTVDRLVLALTGQVPGARFA